MRYNLKTWHSTLPYHRKNLVSIAYAHATHRPPPRGTLLVRERNNILRNKLRRNQSCHHTPPCLLLLMELYVEQAYITRTSILQRANNITCHSTSIMHIIHYLAAKANSLLNKTPVCSIPYSHLSTYRTYHSLSLNNKQCNQQRNQWLVYHASVSRKMD